MGPQRSSRPRTSGKYPKLRPANDEFPTISTSYDTMQSSHGSHGQARGNYADLGAPLSTVTVLPDELWLEVLSYLIKREVKIVRLIGDRRLEVLAASQLFKTAYVAARRGVLETFMQMTNHPTIRHFIREVIYDSSWIAPPSACSRMRSGRWRITEANADLPVVQLFQEQEQIQSGELLRNLSIALKKTTHLRKVVFADISRTAGLPGDRTDCEGVPPSMRGHFECTAQYPARCCLTELRSETRHCLGHQGSFRRQFGGFIPLLQALSSSMPPYLDELDLGSNVYSTHYVIDQKSETRTTSWNSGIPFWFFLPIAGNGNYFDNNIGQIFEGIRRMSLTFCWSYDLKEYEPFILPYKSCAKPSPLIERLKTADNLEELKLCGDINRLALDLRKCLGLKKWSRLRVVVFKYAQAFYQDLVSFLLRHKHSLRHITLDDFNIRDGTWTALDQVIFREMPDLEIITGRVFQDGCGVKVKDVEEEDPTWIPREISDRALSDVSQDFEDFEGREESCDEERDYSDGSEELLEEDECLD
ncbi:hypothetical protein ACLMJK_008750 [Lecanora helva]